MDVTECAPRLWRWTGWHEEWREQVGCVYYERAGAVLLFDPLLPPEDTDRFLRALDRDIERAGGQVHILLTVFWHARSSRTLAERYGARIWAPRRARAAAERRIGRVSDPVAPGETVAAGVAAHASGRSGEVVYWIAEHRALVVGDVLLGRAGSGLVLCPESWLPRGGGHAGVRAALRGLVALEPELVLVSHGEPLLADAGPALAALAAPA